MIVEFTLSNLIILAIASIGGLWALMKVIAVQYRNEMKLQLREYFKVQDVTNAAQHAMLTARLDTLDASAKADTGQWQRVERELLTMKADMPLHYVRREDYIRGQSTLEAKVDGVGMKLENALLRAFNKTV